MGTTPRHLLLLLGVGLLVLFVNLGAPPLWDRDEPRNAGCAREMMERGDWIVPTFNGELRVLKPIMKYWLMISAYHLFGVNEFAARFFSAVFALLTALATYWLGRRLYGPQAGLWAGVIVLTNLLFVMSGHLAKIDAALTFFSMLGLLIYAAATFPPAGTTSEGIEGSEGTETYLSRSWLVWVLFYAALGLAVLAKGLPGALPACVLGMFLLIMRLPTAPTPTTWLGRLGFLLRPFAPGHFLSTAWKMRPLTGLVVVLAVAAPWYVLVGLKTDGEFLRGFFLDHHVGRAMQPLEQHGGPFLFYYTASILAGLFPWSIFSIPLMYWVVRQIRTNQPGRAATVLLMCWVWVYVVLFSCAQTKLPSYIAPCFPALALLFGALLAELCERRTVPSWTLNLAFATLGVVGLGTVAFLIAATYKVPISPVCSLLGLVLMLGSVAALVLWSRQRSAVALQTVGVTATAFIGLIFGAFLPHVGNLQKQEQVCEQLLRENPRSEFGFFVTLEPSWVFYAGRPIPMVVIPGWEVPPADRWKARPIGLNEFLAAGEQRYIITTDEAWPYLKPSVPAGVDVVKEAPRFLQRGNWLIVGRPTATGVAHGQTHAEESEPPAPR